MMHWIPLQAQCGIYRYINIKDPTLPIIPTFSHKFYCALDDRVEFVLLHMLHSTMLEGKGAQLNQQNYKKDGH